MRIAYSKTSIAVASSVFSGNAAGSNGGGLHMIASATELEGVRLAGNKAQIGGAVYATSRVDATEEEVLAGELFDKDMPASVALKNCVLDSNQAVKGGGLAVMGNTAKVFVHVLVARDETHMAVHALYCTNV